MKKPIISAIAAISSKNRALGKDNSLLWEIPEDMKHFKKMTNGHPIIMGRKTFESFGSKALPNRQNIIITRNKNWNPINVYIAHSFEEALEIAKSFNSDEIFNIGGGEIYELGMPFTDRLYLTLVDTELDGDTYFPDYSQFNKVISKIDSFDENYKFTLAVLEK